MVNERMKRVNDLRELQLVSISIYRDLREYCDAHDLQVYLHGGTLLGAVRHQGYIPWDDDIDVCMSRPDYERMLELSEGKISERCSLIDPASDTSFNGYIPVVVYDRSKMVTGQYRTKEDLKIGISIFVFDGVPEDASVRKRYYRQMYLLRAKHALCRADFGHVNTGAARRVGPFLQHFFRTGDTGKYKQKILALQKKYDYAGSVLVSTNADTDADREVCRKADFERPAELWFEGIKSYAYSHYKEHLTKYYGDYMQLPPEEEREPKHSFEAWIDEGFVF